MPVPAARPNFLVVLLLAAVFLLSACATPPIAAPPPTPEAVFLAYPPELRPYAEDLAVCARQYPEISLFLSETVSEAAPDGQTTLFLASGSPPAALSGWQASLLAEDQLVVIVNRENPLEKLSAGALRLLWTGETHSWAALGGTDEAIQIWAYPAGGALRELFDAAVLRGELTSSRAWLAPDPQAALEAMAASPAAIGYVPASWLESAEPELAAAVHTLELPDELNEELRLPGGTIAASFGAAMRAICRTGTSIDYGGNRLAAPLPK
jgi:DNA-binding transcriptional LysR family regulator